MGTKTQRVTSRIIQPYVFGFVMSSPSFVSSLYRKQCWAHPHRINWVLMCAMWVIPSVCRVGGGALRRQPHQSHHQATRVYCEAHYIALNRLPLEQWEAPGPRGRARGWLGLIWRPRGSCSPGPVTTRLSSAAAKLHSPPLLSSDPLQARTVEGTALNEGTKILSSSQESYPAPLLSTSGVSCFISFSFFGPFLCLLSGWVWWNDLAKVHVRLC